MTVESPQCVMRWNLQDPHDPESNPLRAEFAHISVGTLADGGWYVDHTGFGTRWFADKHNAWAVVRHLMRLHKGAWEQVPTDTELHHQPIEPFSVTCGGCVIFRWCGRSRGGAERGRRQRSCRLARDRG